MSLIEERMSWMSQLSRIVLKLTPAKTANERLHFKMFSLKTLLFSMCFFGVFGLGSIVNYFTGYSEQVTKTRSGNIDNVIDLLSQISSMIILSAFNSVPYLVASGLPKISELALDKDLRFPKYGLLFMAGCLLGLASLLMGNYY